jgi:hypothetical protein
MNEIIESKKIFIDSIQELLQSKGFKEVDNNWQRIQQHRLPGQIISINGQRLEQPGQIIEVKYSVHFNEDGWVSNEDETIKRDFTQIHLIIKEGETTQLDHEECFYWDDIEYIIHLLNHIFK